MNRQSYVYIITNWNKTVLYTGVTSDLIKRVFEHKEGLAEGFSKRYNCKMLVYYEVHSGIKEAIAREKQIKGWTRAKKEELINTINPAWKDLYGHIAG